MTITLGARCTLALSEFTNYFYGFRLFGDRPTPVAPWLTPGCNQPGASCVLAYEAHFFVESAMAIGRIAVFTAFLRPAAMEP